MRKDVGERKRSVRDGYVCVDRHKVPLMTRAQFIQTVLAHGTVTPLPSKLEDALREAEALADALEKSGVAPRGRLADV